MTLWNREREGKKMLGYGWSSFNENHMQDCRGGGGGGGRRREEEGGGGERMGGGCD